MESRGTQLRPLTSVEAERGTNGAESEHFLNEVDLRKCLRALLLRWKTLLLVGLLAGAAGGVLSKFVFTKWYRAQAILKPVSQTGLHGQIASLMGAFNGGGFDLGALTGMGMSSGPMSDAEEYITILQSFWFTQALVEKHGLAASVLPGEFASQAANLPKDEKLQWLVYQALEGRFDAEYSVVTGNLDLSYVDRSPAEARRVLGFYIADLRQKLRDRAEREARAAAGSLREEAKATGDVMLQRELYELIAREIEQERLAQVEADFAFVVLEPPVARIKPYYPKTLLNCVLYAFVALFLVSGWIVVRTLLAQGRNEPSSRYASGGPGDAAP